MQSPQIFCPLPQVWHDPQVSRCEREIDIEPRIGDVWWVDRFVEGGCCGGNARVAGRRRVAVAAIRNVLENMVVC